MTKQEDIDKIVSKTISTYGRIDILLYLTWNGPSKMPPLILPGGLAVFDLNLTQGLPRHAERKWPNRGGRIAFMTSQRGISAMQNIAPYCITKGAVMAMVKRWPSTWAPGTQD